MINQIIESFKKIDSLTYKIIKKGLLFSLVLSAIAGLSLIIYSIIPISVHLYYIGLTLFKLSSTLCVEFIICGLAMDTIKKQLL